MSALTDWLLEQIEADERRALWLMRYGPLEVSSSWSKARRLRRHPVTVSDFDPHEILERCAALRSLVERHDEAWEQCRPNGTPTRWGKHVWGGLVDALRIMARIYADRPGYAEAIE